MNTNNKYQAEFTTLEIIAKDRTGLVNEITGIISELNISILHHRARVFNHKHKGMISEFKVDIKAENFEQIGLLIHRLNRMKGIISVTA